MTLSVKIHKYEVIQSKILERGKKLPKLMLVKCRWMLVTFSPVAHQLSHQLPPAAL